ncbi:chromate transporter [Gottschalkiaceae bacterium SANA]|nr:chromate transporter [Gottschalkiaceae bacterium SANA]
MKKLFKLFTSTFYLSAFTFGGGYVIISLMKKKFVDELHWMEEEEMLNYTAIAQSAPGAVAVNGSILVGFRIAGFPGALAAIFGTILPPLIIISVLFFFYEAFRSNPLVGAVLMGMQAGVAAVIADVVTNLASTIIKKKDYISSIIMVLAFAATYSFGINVMAIIGVCAVIGIIREARLILKKEASHEFSSTL